MKIFTPGPGIVSYMVRQTWAGDSIVQLIDGALRKICSFGQRTRMAHLNSRSHRADYTVEDAQAIAAWLNEREGGYVKRALPAIEDAEYHVRLWEWLDHSPTLAARRAATGQDQRLTRFKP